MAVEFICSRTEAKTEEYILSKIKAQVEKDPLASIIVLVPPQATLLTENHIMRALSLKGLMGVWVMGPEKLTQRILDTVHGRAKQAVDVAGKSMAVRLLLERYSNELPVLSECARVQNISPDIAEILSEFKTNDILPEQLAGLEPEDKKTGQKLKDLAFLYEKFEEYMQSRGGTGEDRMNIAIHHAKETRFIAQSDVYVLDFGLYTAQMARFVAEIARTAKKTAVTFLDTHPTDPDADLFEISRSERAVLAKAIGMDVRMVFLPGEGADGEAGHVAGNLYAYPYTQRKEKSKNIRIVRALTPEEEVEAAAETIARLLTEEDCALREIAVVSGSANEYAPIIKSIFTQANIPFFLNDQRSALQNFAAYFLLSALQLAGGRLSKDKLLSHLELAFGLGDPDIPILKNYAYKNIANAYRFEKPFPSEEAESARTRCALPALAFRKKTAGAKTAGEKISLLLEYMQEMRLKERIEANLEAFITYRLPEAAEYYEQAYKKIEEVLEQAKNILGDIDLSAYELAEILKSGFESVSISLIPQGADEVAVGDIGISRLKDIRALIVLGVCEGKIPNYEEEAGILSQNEKDYILEEILHRRAGSLVDRQKIAIYRMFSLPAEKLFLSYPEISEGAKQQPSVLIARMHEILTIEEVRAKDVTGSLRENAVKRAAAELRDIADGYTDRKKPYLAGLLAREDTREVLIKFEKFAAREGAAQRLDRHLADELYGRGTASVSRFETYYACPFRHYVLYGLKPEVPRECKIESLDVGNFVHGVLDRFSKGVRQAGRTWSGITEAETAALLRESAQAEQEKDPKYTLSVKNKNALQIVERELYWAIAAIRQHFKTSDIQMVETEHRFETEIAGVRLTGVIDRLDLAKIGDEAYFKVVDYKTGERSWSLQDFAEGLSLQLVIYMLAGLEYFKQQFSNIQAAGADYFTIKLPLLEEFDREKILAQYKMKGLQALEPDTAKQVYGYDGSGIVSLSLRLKKDGEYHGTDKKDVYSRAELTQLMEYAKKLVARAAGQIESGDLKVAPVSNQNDIPPCTYCDFRAVCMLDDADMPGKKEKRGRDGIFADIKKELGHSGPETV